MPTAIVYVDTDEHAAELERMLEAMLSSRHPAHGRIDVRVVQDPLVYTATPALEPDAYVFDSEEARDLFVALKDWNDPVTLGTSSLLDMAFVRQQAASMLIDHQAGELLIERGVSFQDMPPDVAIDIARWWAQVDTLPQAELDAALDERATELIEAGYDEARTIARRKRRLEVVRQEAQRRIELFNTGNPETGQHWINAVIRDAFGAIRAQVRVEDERPAWTALGVSDTLVEQVRRQAVQEAAADPDFAIRLDWARRYKDTNPEAAEYLAAHQEELL